MRRRIRIDERLAVRFAALGAVLVLTAGATAQTSRPDREEEARGSEAPRGLLAGPKVEETEKAGDGASFLARRVDRQRAGGARRRLRLVGELELTREQRDGVRTEVARLARVRGAFQREHGQELRSLEKEIRAARRGEQPVSRDKAARMQELRAMAPRPDAAQERIWSMLTDAQQRELRSALVRPRPEGDAPRDRAGGPTAPKTEGAVESDLDEAGRRRLRFLLERRDR